MSAFLCSTILVVSALAMTADVPRASSAANRDVPNGTSVASDQEQSPSADTDSSRPTLKTPGSPSGADPAAQPPAAQPPPAEPPAAAPPAAQPPEPGDNAAPPSPPPAQPAAAASQPASPPAAPAPVFSSQPLQDPSRLLIIRGVDGEFAKTQRALPGKDEGFTLFVGKPIDEQKMSDALRLQGTALNMGERVQITQVEFEPKKIIVQLNGGTKKKFHLRDHLQVGLAGPYTPDPQAVDHHEGLGAVIVLDFGRPLPEMSPDDVKRVLSPLLDFSQERSATVNWVESIPQKYQDAIADHKTLVGMDEDMVIAALGHPDKKVRERNDQGIETEDWIYGNPPARTTFVTFIGDKVTKVEEFN